jgi:hypothetical protein
MSFTKKKQTRLATESIGKEQSKRIKIKKIEGTVKFEYSKVNHEIYLNLSNLIKIYQV